MKRIVIIIAIFILIVITIGAIILYNNIFPLAKPIELPIVNQVYAIEIKKWNSTSKHIDDKEILEVWNCFFNAKPTREMVAHDIPIISDYYTVNFFSEEERLYKSFIYNKNSKWYIEQPYYGVYEIKEELLDFLP